LFISKEILALQIASIQNLSFYMNLVKEARQKIEEQSFKAWKDEAVRRYMKRL
jgi:queuine tRNA-ribosyltransferase